MTTHKTMSQWIRTVPADVWSNVCRCLSIKDTATLLISSKVFYASVSLPQCLLDARKLELLVRHFPTFRPLIDHLQYRANLVRRKDHAKKFKSGRFYELLKVAVEVNDDEIFQILTRSKVDPTIVSKNRKKLLRGYILTVQTGILSRISFICRETMKNPLWRFAIN